MDPDVLDGVIVSGSSGEIDWDDPAVRQHLAGALGMEPGEIWSSTWAWLKGLHLGPEYAAAIDAAAQRSAGAKTPVAPFRGHLAECLPRAGEFRAEREQQAADTAAEAEARRQAAEQAAREEQEREQAERDAKERRRQAREAQQCANREAREAQEREYASAKARLTPAILEYVREHPGAEQDEIVSALGEVTNDIYTVLHKISLADEPRLLRRDWRKNPETSRHSAYFYLSGHIS